MLYQKSYQDFKKKTELEFIPEKSELNNAIKEWAKELKEQQYLEYFDTIRNKTIRVFKNNECLPTKMVDFCSSYTEEGVKTEHHFCGYEDSIDKKKHKRLIDGIEVVSITDEDIVYKFLDGASTAGMEKCQKAIEELLELEVEEIPHQILKIMNQGNWLLFTNWGHIQNTFTNSFRLSKFKKDHSGLKEFKKYMDELKELNFEKLYYVSYKTGEPGGDNIGWQENMRKQEPDFFRLPKVQYLALYGYTLLEILRFENIERTDNYITFTAKYNGKDINWAEGKAHCEVNDTTTSPVTDIVEYDNEFVYLN